MAEAPSNEVQFSAPTVVVKFAADTDAMDEVMRRFDDWATKFSEKMKAATGHSPDMPGDKPKVAERAPEGTKPGEVLTKNASPDAMAAIYAKEQKDALERITELLVEISGKLESRD